MIKRDVTLEEVIGKESERKCFSWSVTGNPTGCKLPQELESKEIETSVVWGISQGYVVIAGLLDATIYDRGNTLVEVGRIQNKEELKKMYPELFSLKGIFYIM